MGHMGKGDTAAPCRAMRFHWIVAGIRRELHPAIACQRGVPLLHATGKLRKPAQRRVVGGPPGKLDAPLGEHGLGPIESGMLGLFGG